ncbi:MAG: polysaccharide biosynthesis/export family protein [Paracoccaceae bacterium]|jgi:polysaccharide biosynthesis/export protein VpsN|nr:polysaccharide biosynthesis/export family protein [Paracoccaceae bacterium]
MTCLRLIFIILLTPFIAAAAGEYQLGAGDKLKITIFDEPDLSGEFELDCADGVALPLIGQMQALDLSPRELKARIEAKLLDGYLLRPRVSIEVLSY